MKKYRYNHDEGDGFASDRFKGRETRVTRKNFRRAARALHCRTLRDMTREERLRLFAELGCDERGRKIK